MTVSKNARHFAGTPAVAKSGRMRSKSAVVAANQCRFSACRAATSERQIGISEVPFAAMTASCCGCSCNWFPCIIAMVDSMLSSFQLAVQSDEMIVVQSRLGVPIVRKAYSDNRRIKAQARSSKNHKVNRGDNDDDADDGGNSSGTGTGTGTPPAPPPPTPSPTQLSRFLNYHASQSAGADGLAHCCHKET